MENHQGGMPAVRSGKLLRWSLTASLLLSVLVLAASLAGLTDCGGVYPAEELRRGFPANDLANLFVELPVLLACIWLAWSRRPVGLLCLPGALLSASYNEIIYVVAGTSSPILFVHLTAFVVATAAAIVALANTDGAAVRRALNGVVPHRAAGGVLAGMGALFFLRAVVELARTSGLAPRMTAAVNIADLLFCPVWVIGGIALWRRSRLGFASATALLLQAGILFAALAADVFFNPLLSGGAPRILDIAVVLSMGAVAFVPLGLFLRALAHGRAGRTALD